ncbi:MAG: lipocalin-like domain-containing protein [Gammaproteobacteria bacterium]|nr:lipocalin-like domain-containing protein [Gammaproteobacteria bacterium]
MPRTKLPKAAALPALLLAASGSLAGAAGRPGHALRPSDLVGAWRLVRIDYSGPDGPAVDPFYGPAPTGLIVYDASGWMSVQIVSHPRRAWRSHADRRSTSPTAARGHAALKAAAYDGYYAYYGAWRIVGGGTAVEHVVSDSLDPAEDGHRYRQQVRVANGCMTFTNRGGPAGARTTRVKVWARVGAHERCAG